MLWCVATSYRQWQLAEGWTQSAITKKHHTIQMTSSSQDHWGPKANPQHQCFIVEDLTAENTFQFFKKCQIQCPQHHGQQNNNTKGSSWDSSNWCQSHCEHLIGEKLCMSRNCHQWNASSSIRNDCSRWHLVWFIWFHGLAFHVILLQRFATCLVHFVFLVFLRKTGQWDKENWSPLQKFKHSNLQKCVS